MEAVARQISRCVGVGTLVFVSRPEVIFLLLCTVRHNMWDNSNLRIVYGVVDTAQITHKGNQFRLQDFKNLLYFIHFTSHV